MLLERDDELACLSSLLDRATREGGKVAVVRGEAGSGKTSLVRALRGSAPAGTTCLIGICDPLDPPIPMGSIKDLASQHPVVAALFAPTGRADRDRVARELAGLLRRPTLLVMEDLHWMDDATADLLVHVGRRIDETRALLVLTHRTGMVHPALGRVLDAVAGGASASTHELLPLSVDGVSTLVAGTALDPELVYRRTGGNPFFVTEMVASGDTELPTTVASVVLTRMERLGRAAREVVDLSSLAPDGLEIAVAVAVLGDDRVRSGLDEAWNHGLLDVKEGRLVFRHELARQAVAQALPPATAQGLHRRLVVVLEDRAASALARLVHHSVEAADLQRVRRYALLAARSAYDEGANQVAISHVRTILDLDVELDPDEEAQVRELLADAQNWVVSNADNLTARLEAAHAWGVVGDRARQARQLVLTAGSHHHRGDIPASVEVVRRALALIDGLPVDRVVAEVLATVALTSAEITPPDEARRVVDDILAVLGSVAAPEAVSKALRARAWLRILRMGDLDGGFADGLRAMELARGEAPLHVAQQAAILGEALSEARALSHALPLIEESLTAARAHDQPTIVAYALALRAGIRLHQGRLDLAELDAAPVAHADTLGEALRTTVLATVLGRRGVPDADDSLDDPSVVVVCADQSYGWRVAAARAELSVLRGDPEQVGRITDDPLRWATVVGRHAWAAGELRYWRRRAGFEDGPPEPWVALPWQLMLLGDWEGAAREWAARGCPFEQALALSDGSETAQREALDLFTDMGAQAWADLVRGMLRRAGADGVRTRPRTHGADLTDRQREVLALLARGLTDAEIASRLHVSVKTVGHHVSAILMRTGARNRTEAAALSQGSGRT